MKFRLNGPPSIANLLCAAAHHLTLTAMVASTLIGTGCKSDSASNTGRAGPAPGTMSDPKVMAEVERRHVIGPAGARELNYHLDWQYIEAGKNLRHISVQGDSVFALDDRNMLTRLRVDDGSRLWRVPVADPKEVVLGVRLSEGSVYITTGGAIMVLDGATGTQVAKHGLETIASTAPVEYGQFLIYGSRGGQAAWLTKAIGQKWRAYQVSNSIQVEPIISDGYVTMIGGGGRLMVLYASSATQAWGKEFLAEVSAQPETSNGVLYVAGEDQYLWAFDLGTGRELWKSLYSAPLTESPVAIGQQVFQTIPGHGIDCFDALSMDSRTGTKLWTAEGVKGSVITRIRENLYVWDAQSHRLSIVDANRGSLVDTMDVPQAVGVFAAGKDLSDLYAYSKDGRIVRLVPRT